MLEQYLDVLVEQLMASINAEFEVLGNGWDPRVQVASYLRLHGATRHRLYVAMPYASGLLLSSLATGITAEDVRADPSLVQDLAGEIANVLGGNLWPVVEGATGIGLPHNGLPPNPGGTMRRYRIGKDSLLLIGLDEEVG